MGLGGIADAASRRSAGNVDSETARSTPGSHPLIRFLALISNATRLNESLFFAQSQSAVS